MSINRILVLLWIVSICIFLLHFLHVGTAVYGDGRYYYSYLPTFLVQHTFDFTNSFSILGIPLLKSPTGLLINPYSPGPAIVWAFPYLFFYTLFHLFGLSETGVLLQIPVGMWNVSLVIIGFLFVYKSLRTVFSEKISLLSIVTIFTTTQLLFYGAVDVVNSHSSSFFFSSLLVYFWVTKKESIKYIWLWGICLGMLTLIRTQDTIFFLLPFIIFLFSKNKKYLSLLVILMTSFLVFFTQLLLWKIYFGSFFSDPYVSGVGFDFLHPHIVEVLFNKTNGLFLWTPSILFALVGLVLFIKKQKRLAAISLSIIVLEIFVISSWKIWSEGASYSARGMVSALPLFAFGVGYIYENKWIYDYKYLLFFLFSALNVLLIVLFLLNH